MSESLPLAFLELCCSFISCAAEKLGKTKVRSQRTIDPLFSHLERSKVGWVMETLQEICHLK